MADYYKKMPSVRKRFPEPEVTEQYERPIGPDQPSRLQRFESEHQIVSGAAHRVKDAAVTGAKWVQKRGQEINREAQHARGPARSPMASIPADPFGVSRAGNPFAMGPMSGPFMDPVGPIRREAPAPRRRRRKKQRRDYDDEPRSSTPAPFSDPFHIPKSMRHLF